MGIPEANVSPSLPPQEILAAPSTDSLKKDLPYGHDNTNGKTGHRNSTWALELPAHREKGLEVLPPGRPWLRMKKHWL